jgi:hypothetical protein
MPAGKKKARGAIMSKDRAHLVDRVHAAYCIVRFLQGSFLAETTAGIGIEKDDAEGLSCILDHVGNLLDPDADDSD